jgi:hypothetical protein
MHQIAYQWQHLAPLKEQSSDFTAATSTPTAGPTGCLDSVHGVGTVLDSAPNFPIGNLMTMANNH